MKLTLWVAALVLVPNALLAQEITNIISVGQGISSPSLTSTINFSNGYTPQNPMGVIYQDSFRLTGQYDQNGSKGFGAEIGYGAKNWGLAAGHTKRDCSSCEGRSAGAVGIAVADIGVGFRFAEDLYAAGLLFNVSGKHRVGFVGEVYQSDSSNDRITYLGAGYSYVGQSVTFAVDASKRNFENNTEDKSVLVTPGVALRADILQLTLNDRILLNSPNDNETHHHIWFGIGLGDKTWHIAAYADYVNEIALTGSLFF